MTNISGEWVYSTETGSSALAPNTLPIRCFAKCEEGMFNKKVAPW